MPQMRTVVVAPTAGGSRTATIWLAATILSACSQPAPAPQPAPPTPPQARLLPAALTYACESGRSVAVAYPDPRTLQLTYEGRTQVLRAAPAASGTRFVGETLAWRTRGEAGRETGVLSRAPRPGPAGAAASLGEDGPVLERCARPAATPVTATTPPPACRTAQLRWARVGGDAGMGNRLSTLSATNAGPTACAVVGYPRVTLEGAGGRAIPEVRAEAAPSSYLASGEAPRAVVLTPGQAAEVDIAWNVVPNEAGGQTRCPQATTLVLAAPGDAETARVAESLTPCGDRVRVGPFRAPAPAPAQAPTPAAAT